MFSNGGSANQPTPYVNIVMDLYNKGLTPMEIQSNIGDPNFSTQEIEIILSTAGYSIDPTIQDYGIVPTNTGILAGAPDFDRSNINPLEGAVDLAPKSTDLDFNLEGGIASLDQELITKNKLVPPSSSITLSNNEVIPVDLGKLREKISSNQYQDIDVFGMLNNPNVQLGDAVKKILEEEMFKRKSSLGYDEYIGGIGDLGADFQMTGRIIKDVFTQGAEGLVDKGLSALDFIKTNPALRGILSRSDAVEQQRKLDAGEIPPRVPFEFYQSPVIDEKRGPDFLSAAARGFATSETLDNFYKEFEELNKPTNLKTVEGNNIEIEPELVITDLNEEAKQKNAVAVIEDKINNGKPISEAEKVILANADADADDAESKNKVITEIESIVNSNSVLNDPSFLGSEQFRRFLKNVGTGLVSTGQIGSGLAAGSVLAANEETEIAAKEKELQAELLKASIEKGGGIDYNEAKADIDVNTSISEGMNKYNNTYNAILDLNYAIDQVNKNPDKVTGPRGAYNRVLDQIKAAISDSGQSFEDLSPATKVETIARLLSNEQVKEILGESGRTISNIDRQIVATIFGTPGLLVTPGALKMALNRSRDRLVGNLGTYKNELTSNLGYFQSLGRQSILGAEPDNLKAIEKIFSTDIGSLKNILRTPGDEGVYLKNSDLNIDLFLS
tara:strand:+ start:1426 stop:3441 length:2016 start_codon:yes stop_codon:yes gene_type:complete